MTAPTRRLLRHAPAVRRFVGVGAAIGVATALLVIAQAELLATTVASGFLGGAGVAELAAPLMALSAVVLGRAALSWGAEVAAQRAAAAAVTQLRAAVLDHVLRLGPRHPGLPATGGLATLASRGVDGLDGYVGRYLPQLLVGAVVPLVVAVRILTADWVSALVVGVTVPLIPVFMVLIGLHTRARTGRQWRALAVLGHHFVDVVAGLDVLTAYGRARRQGQQIGAMSERYRVETMRGLRVAFLSSLVLELLATLSVALVAVSVGLRLVGGQLDLATGLLVIILAPEVYQPLRAVAARFHDSAEGAVAAESILAVLDTPCAEPAPGRAEPAPDPADGAVRLDAVGVDGRSGPVFDAVSITIAPGEVLGLTGPSGAGKSTLLDLLLGWRRPDRGAVTVAGTDLADVDRDDWLRRVAWVPQRPVLVEGTVGENLRLGAPDASDARVAAVAASVALGLPLDTAVHERGQGLSTGQQRRVALARALLADRPLLLLDEPTEGIDAESEAALLAALPAALAGRTTVVVSHRRAVLGLCDRVVALPGAPAAPIPAGTVPAGTEPAPAPGPAPARPPDPEPAAAGVPDSPAAGLRGLLAVVHPHRGRLAVAVLAGSGALGSAVALAATSAYLISAAALQPPVLTLIVAIVAVRTFGLAKGLLRYAERLASHDVALRVLAVLRVRLWDALVRLGPAVSGRLRSGELLARMVGDVDAQQDVLVRALVPAASAAVVGAGTVTLLAVLLPEAGVVLAAGLVLAGVVAPALTVSLARRAARRTAAARGAVVGAVVELLDGSPDLLAFGAAGDRRRTLATLDGRLLALHRRAATATGLGVALTVLAVGGATVLCTALGVAAVRAGVLPGTALAVLALTPLATAELVAALPDAAQRLATALPAARRLAELERAPAAVSEPDRPRAVPPGQRLDTRALSVRWPGSDRDAVAGLDLRLPAGERLVLTGPTGSGKTTVLAALLRTLEPWAGAVHLDGIDTREVLGDDLRARIAWCGPATHLFDSTLRQNLLLARPEAGDDEIVHALRRAGLGKWLACLPEGMETAVGRHGGAVSGGERQRIGLARALLADRPVLLLDEPTAHLDAVTAAHVCADLLRVTTGRTALVVTHRPEELPGLPRVSLSAPAPRRDAPPAVSERT
ncbi:thiol reductant ABC exporter subunit CydD [Pseudonocardia xinjiangensis]|uniref:Thiol reductant ABC exporter subunit CydD n=1 Tax=Pseudonocardia xinjiangensis TaxID=75289 RepID=A0ABX1RAY6_9PSEU|nr:thiol reductant ABC exporter subunit CydD [Pseudonocardia xinjiangensis]NMH77566.1 thiol reductant ABC exporter subunit CydD [Pseudonocardia xinjiangensis]